MPSLQSIHSSEDLDQHNNLPVAKYWPILTGIEVKSGISPGISCLKRNFPPKSKSEEGTLVAGSPASKGLRLRLWSQRPLLSSIIQTVATQNVAVTPLIKHSSCHTVGALMNSQPPALRYTGELTYMIYWNAGRRGHLQWAYWRVDSLVCAVKNCQQLSAQLWQGDASRFSRACVVTRARSHPSQLQMGS